MLKISRRRFVILLADDDADDRLLAQDALLESGIAARLLFVTDGAQLLEHLRAAPDSVPSAQRPDLLLLDLNVPGLDGRAALREIKNDPRLRRLPVVVWTTSSAETDIAHCYDQGANSYITKAVTFEGLVDTMRQLGRYWAQTVQLPPQ